MSSFVQEFKRYQRQERFLTAAIVMVSMLGPVLLTLMLDHRIHWAFLAVVGVVVIAAALWLHVLRNRVSEKLLSKYENLDIGYVLAKKTAPKNPRRFVITNRGFNHYYLKCLNTGEQMLVSKHRIKEDFDIAN